MDGSWRVFKPGFETTIAMRLATGGVFKPRVESGILNEIGVRISNSGLKAMCVHLVVSKFLT